MNNVVSSINEKELINEMLNIIMASSHPMPQCVFDYYVRYKKKKRRKEVL